MVKKFKKQKKLSKAKKDKNQQKNINKISFKKLSKIKIENYQKGFFQKYQNVLILQDGNILVNTADNILIIYDKNNFSAINKYDINYSEEKYISSLIQLNNGYFASCLSFYSSKTDLIIFDISKNKVKMIQKIIFDQMVAKIACMTNWDLVVGIFGYCQFYKFNKENYVLKDTIKFKYGNFYVTQIYEIEKNKILFVGDHDCGNFSGAFIYHMLNGQKQLLFEVSDKFCFELYDKTILLNNKYIIIASIDKTIIVFDINNKQINLIKEYNNDSALFNIIKINDNYFLTGDYKGYLTLYNFDNGEINEIKNKKVSKNHFSITVLRDKKIIILDKRTGDLTTYQIDGIQI